MHPIHRTLEHLETLKTDIQTGAFFDIGRLQSIADQLQADSSAITRQIKKHDIQPISQSTREQLLRAIKAIEDSADFQTQLGDLQDKMHQVLKDIKIHVKAWQSKVEKADLDSSR